MISPKFEEPLVQLVLHSFKHFTASNRSLQPRTPKTSSTFSRPWDPWNPWGESAAHGPPVLRGHLRRNASRSVELDRPWPQGTSFYEMHWSLSIGIKSVSIGVIEFILFPVCAFHFLRQVAESFTLVKIGNCPEFGNTFIPSARYSEKKTWNVNINESDPPTAKNMKLILGYLD